MKYRIRFNKSRGQPGRGSAQHVWRVFDETGKEWLVKHFEIKTESRSELDPNGVDYNLVASGEIELNREESKVVIK